MGVLRDVSYALKPPPGRRPQPVGYDIDLGLAAVLVPTIAAIDIGTFDRDTGQPLDLLDLFAERVAVIRTAR